MTDEQLALQAVSDAQRILEEYLEPRPRNNERFILDKLVEVLERPDLLLAVDRCSATLELSANVAHALNLFLNPRTYQYWGISGPSN